MNGPQGSITSAGRMRPSVPDRADAELLEELLHEPCRSLTQIAKSIGKHRQTLWRQRNRLVDAGALLGASAVLDEEKLGWQGAVLLLRVKPVSEELQDTVISGAAETEVPGGTFVKDVTALAGDYDWMITFAAADSRGVREFRNAVVKALDPILSGRPVLLSTARPLLVYGKPVVDAEGSLLALMAGASMGMEEPAREGEEPEAQAGQEAQTQ